MRYNSADNGITNLYQQPPQVPPSLTPRQKEATIETKIIKLNKRIIEVKASLRQGGGLIARINVFIKILIAMIGLNFLGITLKKLQNLRVPNQP